MAGEELLLIPTQNDVLGVFSYDNGTFPYAFETRIDGSTFEFEITAGNAKQKFLGSCKQSKLKISFTDEDANPEAGHGDLHIAGSITGDEFPSTEAFVVDQSGTKVFLGVNQEKGGVTNLVGDNKKDLIKVDIKIQFDKKGNFTSVRHNGEIYTTKEWNENIKKGF